MLRDGCVWQVAAEIEARYSKRQKKEDFYTVGVLTRDDREHVDNCQILVRTSTQLSCAISVATLAPARLNLWPSAPLGYP